MVPFTLSPWGELPTLIVLGTSAFFLQDEKAYRPSAGADVNDQASELAQSSADRVWALVCTGSAKSESPSIALASSVFKV